MRFRKEKTSDEVLAQEIRECVKELNRLKEEAKNRGLIVWFRTYGEGQTWLEGLKVDSINRRHVISF